mmetsp:Transcript_4378/g.12943  ORF Transcript_4378/g.12943 Transcript_4378/m.12943 type:complete len:83 (-) Transcript_4378:777-1025(-)
MCLPRPAPRTGSRSQVIAALLRPAAGLRKAMAGLREGHERTYPARPGPCALLHLRACRRDASRNASTRVAGLSPDKTRARGN